MKSTSGSVIADWKVRNSEQFGENEQKSDKISDDMLIFLLTNGNKSLIMELE
jgi:hypothetical protein